MTLNTARQEVKEQFLAHGQREAKAAIPPQTFSSPRKRQERDGARKQIKN